MASIGEVVESLRKDHPSVCWRPDPEFENVCINALGHSGPCGWERNAGPCGDAIHGFGGRQMVCTLDHGHTGMHRSDDDVMWHHVDGQQDSAEILAEVGVGPLADYSDQ